VIRLQTSADGTLHPAGHDPAGQDSANTSNRWASLSWQLGIVVRDTCGQVWLELPDPTVCDRCRRGEGCGSASFLRLFRRAWHRPRDAGPVRLPLDPVMTARFPEGAPVRAGIDDRWLIHAALRLYLVPLMAFLAVLWIAAWLLPGNEPGALVLAVVFGAASMALAGRGARPPRLTLVTAMPDHPVELESGARRCHLHGEAPGADSSSAKPE